jgi:replicative superfamily II helicase
MYVSYFTITGDMQLTKQEIADAQLLVATPEKYDVVTRKGGDGSLGTMVSLIIIDEVHLLADERGAVLETIVARTHRYVEHLPAPDACNMYHNNRHNYTPYTY